MIIDLTKPRTVDPQAVGGKGYNLHKLVAIGMPVPPTIVVPHDFDIHHPDNQATLLEHPIFADKSQLFAVRSSGNGEDSDNNSFAGMFDTFLEVEHGHVIENIHNVRKSVESSRSQNYSQKRGTKVIGMNVVIQHMVKADYAGVAFSVSPIEKDKRIMLIELVKGTGDALVSGKVTPTTIRYNKLTRSHRIEQTGADPIDGGIITAILDELVPLLLTIEEAYGHPVDVEWAVDNEKVYILQARPITT